MNKGNITKKIHNRPVLTEGSILALQGLIPGLLGAAPVFRGWLLKVQEMSPFCFHLQVMWGQLLKGQKLMVYCPLLVAFQGSNLGNLGSTSGLCQLPISLQVPRLTPRIQGLTLGNLGLTPNVQNFELYFILWIPIIPESAHLL